MLWIGPVAGLLVFAIIAAVVPGPNVFMFSAGLESENRRRAAPHWFGVGWGTFLLVAVCGLVLIGLLRASPNAYVIIKAIAVAYLVLTALRIGTGRPFGQPTSKQAGTDSGQFPLGFFHAALIQWMIPANWAVAIVALTLHLPVQTGAGVLFASVIVALGSLLGLGAWALMSSGIRRARYIRKRMDPFWLGMGSGLLLAVVMPLAGSFG